MQAGGFGPLVGKTTVSGSSAGFTMSRAEIKDGGIIIANTGSSNIALILPPITSDMEQKPIYIMNKTGGNVVTVVAVSGDGYYGGGASTNYDTVTLTEAGAMAIVMAVDGDWYAVAAAVIA